MADTTLVLERQLITRVVLVSEMTLTSVQPSFKEVTHNQRSYKYNRHYYLLRLCTQRKKWTAPCPCSRSPAAAKEEEIRDHQVSFIFTSIFRLRLRSSTQVLSAPH